MRNLWRRVSFGECPMPLDDLVDASNKVAEGDYSMRVEEKGTARSPLADAWDSIRWRSGCRSMTSSDGNMLADVSHELRTPITVIQGNVEGILDGMYPADEARLEIHSGGNPGPFTPGG